MKKKEEKYEKSLARDDALAVGVVVGGGDATVVVGEESGHPGHYQSHVQIFLDSDLITISDISTWLYIGSADIFCTLFADERKLKDIETTSPPKKVVSISLSMFLIYGRKIVDIMEKNRKLILRRYQAAKIT